MPRFILSRLERTLRRLIRKRRRPFSAIEPGVTIDVFIGDDTILFNDDGTFEGKADCNSFSGTYSQENGFTITLGPSTMAFCGEASLDVVYLDLLSNVAAGGPDGAGGLALETAGGAQRMLFNS